MKSSMGYAGIHVVKEASKPGEDSGSFFKSPEITADLDKWGSVLCCVFRRVILGSDPS